MRISLLFNRFFIYKNEQRSYTLMCGFCVFTKILTSTVNYVM